MKHRIFCAVLLVAALTGLILLVQDSNKSSQTKVVDAHLDPAEYYILDKLVQTPVPSKFTPVLIYRTQGGTSGSFAGSGSLITVNGVEQVITAEHLISHKLEDAFYAYRIIRPLEKDVTHAVEMVKNRGAEMAPGLSPDVLIFQGGPSANMIDCNSERMLVFGGAKGDVAPYLEPWPLRCLVTDKQVRAIGTIKVPEENDGGVKYILLDHRGIPGESGSGFVDGNDNLYVLKGSFDVPPNEKAAIRKMFGPIENFTLVYGPLNIRK